MNYSNIARSLLKGFFKALEDAIIGPNATSKQKVWLQRIIFDEAGKYNPKVK